MKLKDHILTGFISGIIAPVVAFFVYARLNLSDENLFTVMRHVKELGILSAMISLCAFANLLVFFVFIWLHADRSARGVLGATFVYAFTVVILKLT